jgi:molecular chaperone DnaK (HSP70)
MLRGGSALQVSWDNSLSPVHDNQIAIDLHFLFGSAEKASQNHSLDHWYIEQIQQAGKAQTNITITLEIDEMGKDNISAELGGVPLKVRALGDITKAPTD